MRELQNSIRVISIMEKMIDALELDLTGLTVLTEAASGPYVCTPLIAALAGAKVNAIVRDSVYGSIDEVVEYSMAWAKQCGVENRINISSDPVIKYAPQADILTNLGFLRPITSQIVDALPVSAVIPLMWEGWEFRSDDLDLAACRRRGIPVIGTCETHPSLKIFDYLGMVIVKLLLEVEIEVMHGRFALVASDPFGQSIKNCLLALGAQVVTVVRPTSGEEWNFPDPNTLDALIVAEHRSAKEIIGSSGGIPPAVIGRIGSPVIHLCGNIDDKELVNAGIRKHPSRQVKPGYMTVATDYCGPRPVINLHAGGLKVGELMARSRQAGLSTKATEEVLVASGYGSLLPIETL